MREFSLTIECGAQDASDLLMDIDYDGSVIELFKDGKKIAYVSFSDGERSAEGIIPEIGRASCRERVLFLV